MSTRDEKLVERVIDLASMTDHALKVLRFARQAADALGHHYIGSEHILIGLMMDDGVGAGVLEHRGISLQMVENDVIFIVGRNKP